MKDQIGEVSECVKGGIQKKKQMASCVSTETLRELDNFWKFHCLCRCNDVKLRMRVVFFISFFFLFLGRILDSDYYINREMPYFCLELLVLL